MIKPKLKKLGVFAVAAVMAASVAPAATATSFAAEDGANAVITEEETENVMQGEEQQTEEQQPEEQQTDVQQEEEQQPDSEVQEEPSEETVPDTEVTEPDGTVNTFGLSSASGSQFKANGAVSNLSLGKEYTGTMAAGGTKDFSFTTSNRDSYYDIVIINTSVDGNLYGYLFDEKKVQVDYTSSIHQNSSETFEHLYNGEKLKPSTKYYLKVQAPYAKKSGQFTVIVREINDNMGNSFDKAKVISPGTLYGAIEVDGFDDEDWMKFTVPSTGKYRVVLTNTKSNGSIMYRFYDRYAVRMDGDYGDNYIYQNRSSTKDYTFSAGQVYYIAISSFYVSNYTFSIYKLKNANTMTAKGKTVKVKKSKLKKKAQRVKAINVRNAKGVVTYRKISGSKKLSINKKTGRITIKKKTKKGKYTMKVRVTAAGTGAYYAKARTVKVTIKVK